MKISVQFIPIASCTGNSGDEGENSRDEGRKAITANLHPSHQTGRTDFLPLTFKMPFLGLLHELGHLVCTCLRNITLAARDLVGRFFLADRFAAPPAIAHDARHPLQALQS